MSSTGAHPHPAHPHDHGHEHGHGHAHPPPPKPKKGHGVAIGAAIIGLLVAAVAGWLALKDGQKPEPTGLQLVAQLRDAAAGTIASPHVFGGALSVSRAGGHPAITAEGVPSKICVQIGWQLAKEGTVVVNGVFPQRISAAKLAELCSMNGDVATITWTVE